MVRSINERTGIYSWDVFRWSGRLSGGSGSSRRRIRNDRDCNDGNVL